MGGRVSGTARPWIASRHRSRQECTGMSNERTAIVTGAAKRAGAEIARALMADGWSVVAHVHHSDDTVPPGVTKAVADLADPECAQAIFAAASGLPPVRLLVNNAARFAWDGLEDFNAEE